MSIAHILAALGHRSLGPLLLTVACARYLIAAVCALTAWAMPPLELVLFTATTVGIAVTLFGLALTVDDALMVVPAGLITAATGSSRALSAAVTGLLR